MGRRHPEVVRPTGLDGPRTAGGPGWRLEPSATPAVAALPWSPPTSAGVGRRTLVVGDRHVPWLTEGGAPAHLVLPVRR